MAVLPIVHVPDPVLRQKTKKVKKIDASIQTLIDDMIETMYDAPGVGLAANQIGVALRICVIHANDPDHKLATDSSPGLIVLINPEIVRRSGSRFCEVEGCLSLPGYRGEDLPRSEKVVVKGQNRDGRPVRYHGSGLFGEAIEHEVDHLNGILYFDYLDSMDKLVPYTAPEEPETAADDPSTGLRTGDAAATSEEEVAAKGS